MTDAALTLVTSTEAAPVRDRPARPSTVKKPKKSKTRKTRKTREAPAPDLVALAGSWELALRAERKSSQTVKAYLTGVSQYLAYCANHDLPAELDRRQLARFVDYLLSAGSAPATAVARQLGVRRFASWLADEGELEVDPFLGVKAPKIDEKVVEPLSEDQLRAMLKACAGKDLRDRRDEAIIRFMAETGTRAGEAAALGLDDVDLANGVAIVRRGKGGKGRSVPFGPQTGLAIDRYLRLRRGHSLADRSSSLWLGDRGKPFRYEGLHKSLAHRATLAGVTGFHPHRLRHTAAHRWLAAGGSEGGLMAVAGWTRPDMLMRYTKARASARAAEEAKSLNLGDL